MGSRVPARTEDPDRRAQAIAERASAASLERSECQHCLLSVAIPTGSFPHSRPLVVFQLCDDMSKDGIQQEKSWGNSCGGKTGEY